MTRKSAMELKSSISFLNWSNFKRNEGQVQLPKFSTNGLLPCMKSQMLHLCPERQTTGQFGARPPSLVVSSSCCQRTFRTNQKYWVLKRVGSQLSKEKWGFFRFMATMFCLTLLGNRVSWTLPTATCRATCKSTQSLFSHRPGQGSSISAQPELALRPTGSKAAAGPHWVELNKGSGSEWQTCDRRKVPGQEVFAFPSVKWKIPN